MLQLDDKVRDRFSLIKNAKVAYLDNGATTQKPDCVLKAVEKYYNEENANPMRGIYELSVAATDAYENARAAAAEFINAGDPSEIVFTRNASESVNLIAYSYGMSQVNEGDEIIVSTAEHHSNLLPWKHVAEVKKAKVVFYDPKPDGEFDIDELSSLLNEKTKIVAITQVSNVIGRINDIKAISKLVHEKGAVLVVDGAQAIAHIRVNVKELGADFYVFSGHKMYAPMGIGVMYGRKELLEKMPPFLFGGEMIESVTKERTTYAEVPHKFEAGTVNVGGAVGLHAAMDFIKQYGFEQIVARENMLTSVALDGMREMSYVDIIGGDMVCDHHGIVAFRVEGVHPHDVAQVFADAGVCVRAGHHCAEPLHRYLAQFAGTRINSSTRMSIAMYNTVSEVERFLDVLSSIRGLMGLS